MYSYAVNWWIIGAVVVLVIVVLVVATKLGWIDLSDKSRAGGSSGSSMVSIGDEVFAPTRHEAQVEIDRQSVLPAPAPVAGDGDKGIFHDGPVKIRLNANGDPVDPVADLLGGESAGRHRA